MLPQQRRPHSLDCLVQEIQSMQGSTLGHPYLMQQLRDHNYHTNICQSVKLMLGKSSDNLHVLRDNCQNMHEDFEEFKESMLMQFNKNIGKLLSLMYRELANKRKAEEQLNKQINKNKLMRAQVMQLREMIEHFVDGEQKQVQFKNQQIHRLQSIIAKYQSQNPQNQSDNSNICYQNYEITSNHSYSYQSDKDLSQTQSNNDCSPLQIIQEVSEYTCSMVGTPTISTIRGSSFPFINDKNNVPYQQPNNSISNQSSNGDNTTNSIITINIDQSNINQKQQQQRQKHLNQHRRINSEPIVHVQNNRSGKKTKQFLNFFRKKIDQNTYEAANTNNGNQVATQNVQQWNTFSHNSSVDNLCLGDSGKINLPRMIRSPKKMQFLKKSNTKNHSMKQNQSSELFDFSDENQDQSSNRINKSSNSKRVHTENTDSRVKQNSFINCRDLKILKTPDSKASHQKNKSVSVDPNKYSSNPKQDKQNKNIIKNNSQKGQNNKERSCGITKICANAPHYINSILLNSNQKQVRCSSKESVKLNKSNSRTSSKQKLKITSKILEEENMNYYHHHVHNISKFNINNSSTELSNNNTKQAKVRPSVHLGCRKSYLKRLVKQVRIALQELKLWEGHRAKQVKYEGDRKNGMRWGQGKLLYDNGMEYDGAFVQNYRHGPGKLYINGIEVYDGEFSLDEMSGQGYIKFLNNLTYSHPMNCLNNVNNQYKCPKLLAQSSYCGQLLQNKLHGMGTLFINQNQKFMSKFVHGVPVGEYSYYNHAEIQFGNWF